MLLLLLSLCSLSSFSNCSLSPVIFPFTILLAEYLIANPDSNVGPSHAGLPRLLSIKTGQSINLTPSIIFNESFIIPIYKLLKITVLGVPRANLSFYYKILERYVGDSTPWKEQYGFASP